MVKQFIYIFLLLAIITMALYLAYFQLNDECIENYEEIGTFNDYAERILGTSNSDKYTIVNNAKQCRDTAIERGHPYFGLEKNECHTGFLDIKNGENPVWHPKKITDFKGHLNPDNKHRNAVNESRDFNNGKPGEPYKEYVWRECPVQEERPRPVFRPPRKPKIKFNKNPFKTDFKKAYREIARYAEEFAIASKKYGEDEKYWFQNRYITVMKPCMKLEQVDRINTLIPANSDNTIVRSKTDSTPTPAGGTWKMTIYRVGEASSNSGSAPRALNNDSIFDYFTVREGLADMDMDAVNKKYGFTVDNMNDFLPFLVKNIQLKTEVFDIPIQVPTSDYQFKGYYMDGPARTISERMMGGSNWDACKADASANKYKYFAMQHGQECWMGNRMSKEIRLDDNTPDKIPNKQIIESENIPTNCKSNPINTYGNKFGGAYCNAVWERVDSTRTISEYKITISEYDTFIKQLKAMGLSNETEFRNWVLKNKPMNFTTIGESKIIEGYDEIKNVNNNISKEARRYGIDLPMYEDIQHVDNLNELSSMFKSISQYGVTGNKLPEWTRFKTELARIGTIPKDDVILVNALSQFGYEKFDKININGFAEPYVAFGLKPGFDILDIFSKFRAIGVNGKSFAHFTGNNGIATFNSDNYKVNASTFFVPGENEKNSLYFMFSSISFKYDQNTFSAFINQVQSIGEITSEIKISPTSTQEELKNYVLHLNINTQISPVKKFQIFIDTINSIGIKRYDTYQWFMIVIKWFDVNITNIQTFVLKYRYYYIFLSNGMPYAYNRPKEKKVADFVSNDLPVDDYLKPWYWYVILIFIYYIKRIPSFNVPRDADFTAFMNKAVEYGWSFDTLVIDSPIGNTFEKTTRQGFSTIFDSIFNSVTEMFSSISETFMGIKDSFTPLDVTDENESLQKFGVIPINRNNTDLLALFNNYNIYKWDTIMQYIVRMNRIAIPFQMGAALGQLPPLPTPTPASASDENENTASWGNMQSSFNPSSMLDIPTAEKTLELFEIFGVNFSQYDEGKTGLDLFDHLLDVIKVPSSMEMYRFLNKLIEFNVDYSTYYDFMEFFSEKRMNLQYAGTNTNHEIFYMFIDDLMALSENGMVLFDYGEGRPNFETLVNNYQSDIFLQCANKPPGSLTPETSTPQIIEGKMMNLHHYKQVLRNLLYIFYNFDNMVLNNRFNCHEKICNKLIDWTIPRIKGDATSAYQNVLQSYINTTGDQQADLNVKGKSGGNPSEIFEVSIKMAFHYLSESVPPLDNPEPIPSIPCNQLKGTHSEFNIAFCISAITSDDYKKMQNCQYNFTSKDKLHIMNNMIYRMIRKNSGENNNETNRSQSTIETYNKNVQTINFLILYPMFSFETIAAAISNPCESASGCPTLPGNNYDSISDPKNQINIANNQQESSNTQVHPDYTPYTPSQFSSIL